MSHRIFRQLKKDNDTQLKMNLTFIKSLPQTSSMSVKELGRETEEGVVPEFFAPETIKRTRREYERF